MKPAIRALLDDSHRAVDRRSFFKRLGIGAGAAIDFHEVRDYKDLAADDARELLEDAKLAGAARELVDVTAALRRIEQGTYGDCVECGEPIDRRRLDAMPATLCCTACQGWRERVQRSARLVAA